MLIKPEFSKFFTFNVPSGLRVTRTATSILTVRPTPTRSKHCETLRPCRIQPSSRSRRLESWTGTIIRNA